MDRISKVGGLDAMLRIKSLDEVKRLLIEYMSWCFVLLRRDELSRKLIFVSSSIYRAKDEDFSPWANSAFHSNLLMASW